MTNPCYKFADYSTKDLWNRCAEGDTESKYCHCHWLFVCRKNSAAELNRDGQLNSVVGLVKKQTTAKDVPLIVSRKNVIIACDSSATTTHTTHVCFFISNVEGVKKMGNLINVMRYCAVRNLERFGSCEKECREFSLPISVNRSKRRAEKNKEKVTSIEENCLKKQREGHDNFVEHSHPWAHSPVMCQTPPGEGVLTITTAVDNIMLDYACISVNSVTGLTTPAAVIRYSPHIKVYLVTPAIGWEILTLNTGSYGLMLCNASDKLIYKVMVVGNNIEAHDSYHQVIIIFSFT